MKGAVIFGSRSDLDKMKGAATCLKEFGIEYEAHILSAHRVPERLTEVLKQLEEGGCEFIIAGAGLAAHLPGVIASKTDPSRHRRPSGCEIRRYGFTPVHCSDAQIHSCSNGGSQ